MRSGQTPVKKSASPYNMVRAAELHEADYTPWEGRDLATWPSLVMLRGKIVVNNGTFSGDLKDGQFLPRQVPGEIRSRPGRAASSGHLTLPRGREAARGTAHSRPLFAPSECVVFERVRMVNFVDQAMQFR
jgi:hypothetical protein